MQRFKSVGQSALQKVHVLVGDKGYDSNRSRQALMDRGFESAFYHAAVATVDAL
jgi:hypothetical protein